MKVKDFQCMSNKELEELMVWADKHCDMWKSSSDGSHGLCLEHKGYWKARDELRRRQGDEHEDV
jgi:hypothetical protein